MGLDALAETVKPRNESIRIDAQGSGPLFLVNHGEGRYDEPDSTPGPCLEVIEERFTYASVDILEVGSHWGHDNPVLDSHTSDFDRRKKGCILH